MKLYLYYLIDPHAIENIKERGALECLTNSHEPDPGPLLYAATTDKKLAKKYEACHNMNAFKKMVRHTSSDENSEADMWAMKIVERSLLYSEGKHIIVPMTGNEEWAADNVTEVIYDYLCKVTYVDPHIFTKELYDDLGILGYNNFFNTPSSLAYEPDDDYVELRRGIKDWANELGMFSWIFQEIIDLGGIMEVGEIDNDCLVSVRGFSHPK